MTVLSEANVAGDVLRWEVDRNISRKVCTVVAVAAMTCGTVLAKKTKSTKTVAYGTNTGNGTCGTVTLGANAVPGVYTMTCKSIAAPTAGAATGAAVAGNTGNGTITASPTVSSGAKVGVYRLICIEPATDLGKFILSDPEGIELGVVTVGTGWSANGLAFTISDGSTDFASGDSFTITVASVPGNGGIFEVKTPTGQLLSDATVGTAYSSTHLNFTIADGSTDFAVNDTITVTVAGDGKYYPAEYAAVDGTGEACAILLEDLAITAGQSCAILVRDGLLTSSSALSWPASYDTNNKKAVAIAQLETARIFIADATA